MKPSQATEHESNLDASVNQTEMALNEGVVEDSDGSRGLNPSPPHSPSVSGASAAGDASRTQNKGVREDRAWQRSLLPFMVVILTLTTLFFLVASYLQLNELNRRIKEDSPRLDLTSSLAPLDGMSKEATDETKLNYAMWRSLVTLEANALERRYYQAGVMLMARVWTRYLGFVTGMILALVGATFVLGKMRESEANLGANSVLWRVSLTTASPGVILALLGTVLILTTMLTSYDIKVEDRRVFTNVQLSDPKPSPTPPATPYPTPEL